MLRPSSLKRGEPLEPQIRAREQTLSIPQQIQACFKGDRHWTAEALSNLIKNCSEHAEEGGSITIKYHQNPLYTEILVADNGPGFDEEDIPHLFQRFYRGKNAGRGQHRHWPCAVKIPDRAPERNFAGGQRAGRRRLFYRAVLYFPLERLILQRVDDIFLQ